MTLYDCTVVRQKMFDFPDLSPEFPFAPVPVAYQGDEFIFISGARKIHVRPLVDVYPVIIPPTQLTPGASTFVEGVSAIGKSTAIGAARGTLTDLSEMYRTAGSLCCLKNNTAMFNAVKRSLSGKGLVDRSTWLSPLIYDGLYKGIIYVPASLPAWTLLRSSEIIVVVESNSLTNEHLVDRTIARGGIDARIPDLIDYIRVTRALFTFFAAYFQLPIQNPKLLKCVDVKDYINNPIEHNQLDFE
jgi:hypothetical protein